MRAWLVRQSWSYLKSLEKRLMPVFPGMMVLSDMLNKGTLLSTDFNFSPVKWRWYDLREQI